MLGLVLADDLVLLFVFWEIMGLCSYLLIGFWFARKYDDPKRITPKQAGLKAFLTTRVGDADHVCRHDDPLCVGRRADQRRGRA